MIDLLFHCYRCHPHVFSFEMVSLSNLTWFRMVRYFSSCLLFLEGLEKRRVKVTEHSYSSKVDMFLVLFFPLNGGTGG